MSRKSNRKGGGHDAIRHRAPDAKSAADRGKYPGFREGTPPGTPGGNPAQSPSVAHLAGKAARQPEPEDLTGRGREVTPRIAAGNSTKEIASLLGVSVKTIDKPRTRLMEKLRVHDAVAVTRYAVLSGMVSLE